MFRQATLLAAKDTKVFFKDRFAVVFAFLFPLMFVLGFSLALKDVGPEDDQLELTVSTQEESGISTEIIDAITGPPDSPIRATPYHEALKAVDGGELVGFVAFAGDFTAALTTGVPTTLEVVVNAGNPGDQAALMGLARSLASDISSTQTAIQAIIELQAKSGGGATSIDLETVARSAGGLINFETEQVGEIGSFNPSNFTLPGYLTMFVFFAAAMAAESITRERQNQTLERLLSNGVERQAVVVGKYLGTAYKGLMQLAVLWTLGLLAFGIDLGVSPAAVILISVLMVLASSGFGVMLATMVRTVNSASSAGVLASLVMAPLGGSWWPLFIAPSWMQSLAKLTPHGWANAGFNKLMLFGAEFGDVLMEMAALALFGVAFVAVALWRFRSSVAQ